MKTKALLNYSLAKYDTQEDVSALCMCQQCHTSTLDSPEYLARHLLSLPKILHQRWSDLLKLSTPRKIVNRSILTLTRCQGGQNNSKQKQLTNWEWQFQQFFPNSETSGTKFWTTNWQHVSLISPIMKGSDTKIRFNFMETEFPFHMYLENIKCWMYKNHKILIIAVQTFRNENIQQAI